MNSGVYKTENVFSNAGYASWSAYETAVLNQRAQIPRRAAA
jgi:hypothetical protein